ncbi:hypothetical protein FRC01_012710 [Tulasnella sp. 417]|nr:hypothetical protein FRC01_012710 [Tulasnella sp. 417]
MAWSQHVLRQFQLVHPNADGNAYLGPWNKLLYTLFPPGGELADFTVVPNLQESSSRDGLYLSFSIDVYLDDKPVLLVDINKKPRNLRYVSKREEADMQIRRRLRDLSRDCPLPKLFGISAFGTKVRFYGLETAPGSVIDPPLISPDQDGIPESQWDNDVLEDSVADELRGVLRSILSPGGCIIA